VFTSSNLASLFRGDGKARELRETVELWEATEAAWNASPLAQTDPDALAGRLIRETIDQCERLPKTSILIALAEVYYDLYRAEVIGPIDPKWDAIRESVEVASEFRQLLPHRRRWAVDFENMHAAWKKIVLDAAFEYLRALPESCFDRSEQEGDSFDVPLVDLLDDPASIVDRLFTTPYTDNAFRLDLFKQLRGALSANMLLASGLPADMRGSEVGRRMIRATAQKDKTGAELASMYLRDTPFLPLLDCPVPFRIPDELRFEHCHIVGGTGHGKTQLMQKMIHADLLASRDDGRSVIVIDSQGDLINKLVRLELFSPDAPDSLADRLVVIDPADVEFPAALNLFDAHLDRVRDYSAADRERVLNGVIELYEMFFGSFLGAELTQKQGVIFKYLARLMLAIPDATIHTLMRIMEDGKPYKQYMDQLDGSARYFFETEFFHPSFAATKKQVLRRLWGVLSTPAFERMFTQPKNKIDLFEAMNEGKIILVNTAKDLLKREGSQLLGRFFIAMITQAALERSTLSEYLRRPAFVYVDEAQEYFDDSIETILNQARKYRVGLTLAHQTLDQLSPKLRSAILTNTSMKCVGGVSAKDARALSDELRTTPEFIEGMKRRGPRSEFALWVKHLTGQAIRLSVPLGFLEKQPTLASEDYDALMALNRERYCGTLADIPRHVPPTEASPARNGPTEPPQTRNQPRPPDIEETFEPAVELAMTRPTERPQPPDLPRNAPESQEKGSSRPPVEERELGKGGKQHRYLQSLIKELAEQQGLKATIEAPLASGGGQVDVLIERDGVLAAIEISVTTPVEHERENLRKCVASGYPRIAVVLAKSKKVESSYRAALKEIIGESDRERVLFLAPEELPGFIASLAPIPEPTERIVKGYRVRGSLTQTSAEDARSREDTIARLIAKSLNNQKQS
jgi:hypothetical protein